MEPLRVGTRGSPLAVRQAESVVEALQSIGVCTRLVTIETSGDQFHGSIPASQIVGVFTKEIDRALLDGRVDCAVHSLKDVPTQRPAGIVLAAILPRVPPADVLITLNGRQLHELPPQARLGTGSRRRRAQILQLRSDLDVADIRGNVDTRVHRVLDGDLEAVILAEAGIVRLGLQSHISQRFDPSQFLPAVGQGAIVVECRAEDLPTLTTMTHLNHVDSRLAVLAERALLRQLAAGCLAPVGAWARRINVSTFRMDAGVFDLQGTAEVRSAVEWTTENDQERDRQTAESSGLTLATQLLERGADQLLVQCQA